MTKIKLIIPLVMMVPALFGCNKGVAGNYVVDENIAYAFSVGTKEDYEKEKGFSTVFLSISKIQKKIYDLLTTYYGGEQTPDKAVHLTNDYALERKTKSGESIETKAVNVKEAESGGSIKFEWGKEKSGYHFYENHTDYVDYLRVYDSSEGTIPGVIKNIWVGDNGFTVSDNTLTAKFVAKITEGLEEEVLKYQIDFTVTAKK